MTGLYLFLILELFIYKIVLKSLFVTKCYSLPKENVSNDLKKWKISWEHALYYLALIIAIMKPLTNGPITINYFLIGLIPVSISLFLFIYTYITGKLDFTLFIDFLLIEGLSIQVNSWFCSLVGFLYLLSQLIIRKIKNKEKDGK